MADLVYPELSYKVIGLCFECYNKLGYGYQEKYYQRAFAQLLKREKFSFKREQKHIIEFERRIIGRYFIDFVVDNKIVVEFKIAEQFHNTFRTQVLAYLKAIGLKLGILVLITKDGVKYKRYVN